MPIKKRLSKGAIRKAFTADAIRKGAGRGKIAIKPSGYIEKTTPRLFRGGNIKKVWRATGSAEGVRKSMTVTDSQGNIVREIEFDREGKQGQHSFRRPRKRKNNRNDY